MDSFNESISVEILSSLSPSSRDSSRRLTNSTKIKSMGFEMGSHASSDSSSSDLSRVSTPLSVKQFVQTKQHVSRSAIQENEFESTNSSEISSETLSSTTRTSKSRKSYNYEAKKHGRRKKSEFSEENQKHRDNEDIFNIRFNKLNSGSIQKALSKSSYSTDSQSSQESNVLCRRSHQTKNRPANIKCHVDDFEKSEQSDILSLAEFDSNYSRKIKLDGKRYIKNVAVQTIHLEPDNDLLPMFTPLLLKDIAGKICSEINESMLIRFKEINLLLKSYKKQLICSNISFLLKSLT